MDASVPFHASYSRMVPAGWISGHVNGLVRLQAEGLVLEARDRQDRVALTESAGAGGWQQTEGGTATTTIPLEALEGVSFRRGMLLAPRLVIDVRRLQLLDPFPWAKGTRLTLALKLRDRAAARELALAVDMALVDRQLARLEGG